MNRRSFLMATASFAVLSATGARADEDYVKDIVDWLKKQGYVDISVSRTLLGRVRILAANANGKRELICNPRTGEILRDVMIAANGEMRPPTETGTSSSSGPGKSGSDGDDREDNDDDDDHGGHGGDGDDDNSGHGSSGSGGDDKDSSGHGSGHD